MSFSDEDDEGFHFDPTDEEVIKFYVIPKLKNELRESGNFIVTKDVYSVEPSLLEHHNDPIFKENEWYYFVTRTQVSNQKPGAGKNTKRAIFGNNGSWIASNKQDIKDQVTGNTIGRKQTLKFVKNNNKRHKTSDDPVSWIMKEFALPEEDNKFQELVLCRIQKKINKKDKHDHEIVHQGQSFNFIGSASTSTYHHGESSSSSSSKEHQPIDHVIASCSTPAKQSSGEGNNIPLMVNSERCENPLNTPPLNHELPIDVGEIDWNILLDPNMRGLF